MLKSRIMNERSYYTDSYTTTFSSRIIDSQEEKSGGFVILEHTYFYPTSGGQPFDTGTINGIPVINVTIRESDGAILHKMREIPTGEEATAVINWERRFDHMQQHTGQHILSQAFTQKAGGQTVGFHLGDETATIDLDKEQIDSASLEEVENLANRIVWQNRPVVVRWASRIEARSLPLRKLPQSGHGKLRLIDILDFDLTACGGTHVARTGEVGLIKVLKTESRNKKVRIHFCCGGRALLHYRFINHVVNRLTGQLTTGAAELGDSIDKLQEREKASRRALKRLEGTLTEVDAQQLLNGGRIVGDYKLIVQVFTEGPNRIRGLASRLTKEEGVIALLAATGERTHLVFGRAGNTPGDMRELLGTTFQQLGAGSGGGNEEFAQGAGPSFDTAMIWQALENSIRQLLEEIEAIV